MRVSRTVKIEDEKKQTKKNKRKLGKNRKKPTVKVAATRAAMQMRCKRLETSRREGNGGLASVTAAEPIKTQ